MPTPTPAELAALEAQAELIRNETQTRANTAQRVGGLFKGIVQALGASVTSITNLTTFQETYQTVLQDLKNYYTLNGDSITNNFQGTVTRLQEVDPPTPIPRAHKIGDLWINGTNGNIYELTTALLYSRKGNLKGPSGYSVLIAYADNANGDNPSSTPIGKKFRAEYVPTNADANPTEFNPAKVVGAWFPFGNQRTNGVHNGTIINMAIDNQTAADFAGIWNIAEFTNVYAGAQARIKRKSLNNIWAQGPNAIRVGFEQNGTAQTTPILTRVDVKGTLLQSFALQLSTGSTVRINGQVRRVVGANNDNFHLDLPLPSGFATGTYELLVKDTFVLPGSGQALINGVSKPGNFVLNSFGTFIEGATNVIRLECVSVTGTATDPIYEFDLYISNS